ncbi:hypothetical protein B0H99_11339 [Planomicrobium soli]|uniref:Uncharacterized protein n=1 Tax=Planomicrobium soli TaxID=1176648 RepID=A0A2P8G9G9_9BACL|nr:hypothetical protein [Planomicrobium soli]PSL30614.1 hypothetical protein B0H99_11339 [Planomicrobium soli]
MEKNNRDDSVRKDWQETQQFQAADPGADRNIEKGERGDNELRESGTSNTNNDSSNEPYHSDGETTLRKKDPDNPADWRESEAANPSRETGWQKSNDWDDTIREPEGTFTTGERGNVINSATWDPDSHLREEDVGHVDVNDYTQTSSPENQPEEQQTKLHEERLNVNKDRVQKEK